MATLRDVARMSGVSPATVSHVLNNRNQNMSAETRQRVLDAIRALGYRPGAAPGNDAARRARTIGVFLFLWLGEQRAPLRSNPYAVDILDGILSTAIPRHWNVTLISVDAWEDARAQIRLSADGRCDGFVLIAPPPDLEIADALHERGFPFVLINSDGGDVPGDGVDIDNATATREQTERLIALGHRTIAYLPGAEDLSNTRERLRGFQEAFAAAALPDPGTWILGPGTYNYSQSQERLASFLARRAALPVAERPTALICGNDNLAAWARESLREQGIRVPEDLSLAGFDDVPYAATMDPPLTTVRQPLHELGVRATELLLRRIDAGVPEPSHPVTTFLPYEIVFRDSVAPRL